MKKIFFIAIFTIMQSAISSAQNDCGRGYGLSGDNGCIPCANSNQIVHDGICYSCAEKANMSISKCKWDEQQNKAVPVCVSGTALNEDGSNCVKCSNDNQIIVNGYCHTCGTASNALTCQWDEQQNKAMPVCVSGTILNEEGTACIKCSADNQIVHNGKCYTCGGISNALTCKWDEQQNKAIPVCVSGTVLNEEGTACINCSDDNHIVINGKCHSCSEPDIICNKVQNICEEGKALNPHGYCISCTGKNQVIHDGKCLSCVNNTNGSCAWDEENNKVQNICDEGNALNPHGYCTSCTGKNQLIHNGKCYTCGNDGNGSCTWDDENNKAVKVCDEGMANNIHGYCTSCTGKNQVIHDGKCLSCGAFIIGCNSCVYKSSDERIECKSCSQGTLVDGECKVTQTKTCDSGTYLTPLNTCIASCPLNYFANNKTGKCEKKPEGCNEFDEKGDCIGKCWDDFLKRGNECVYSAEGCGSGFDINEALKECILKTIYTVQEADEATSNDNENMIEWIFE